MKIRFFILRSQKNQCIPIGTDLFFWFLRMKKIFSYTNLLFRNKLNKHKTMKQVIIFAALFTVFSFNLVAQDNKANNIDNSNIALQGYSPVSYADLGLAQKGVKTFKSEYKKIIYYFTSAEQKASFDKNPEKYLPQYGGFCAFGIYAGAKFRVNPNKFISKDGKYFLYLSNLELDAQQLWLDEKNHDGLVAKANTNWAKLSATHN